MPRIGITFDDVATAANELTEEGVNPTIEQVRRKLGTGSITTISNHLREWKKLATNLPEIKQNEFLPENLMSSLKGLWEQMIGQSEAKIRHIESETQDKLTSITQERDKYRENNRRWQQLFQQWHEEKEELLKQQHALQSELNASRNENQEAQYENNILLQQLAQRDQQIKHLESHHHEVVASHDKAYASLQHRYEQEALLLKEQNQQLRCELDSNRARLSEAEIHIINIERLNASLAESYLTNESEISKLQQQNASLLKSSKDNDLNIAKLEKHTTLLDAVLSKKDNQLIDLKAETKLLSQHLDEAYSRLDIERNKTIVLQQQLNEVSCQHETQ